MDGLCPLPSFKSDEDIVEELYSRTFDFDCYVDRKKIQWMKLPKIWLYAYIYVPVNSFLPEFLSSQIIAEIFGA